MAAPGFIALSRQSLGFMRDNFRVFLGHLSFVFPLILVLDIVKQTLRLYGHVEWLPLTIIPSFYIYGCFVLSWHRVALNGGEDAKPVNPFRPGAADGGFILLFMGVMGAFSLFMYGLSYMTEIVLPQHGEGIRLAGNIIALIASVAALYLLLRVSFLFPAKAQGVTLSNSDLLRASHRLTWPLLGSAVAFALFFVVIFSVYTLLAGMIATIAGGDAEMSRAAVASMGFVLSIPVHFAIFFFLAICSTALSKAYQWGMGNNPL